MTVRGLSLTAAALAYAKAKVAVFPLRTKSKAPYGRTVGLHMASHDPVLTASRWAGTAQLPLKPIEALREDARKGGRSPSDAELLRPVTAGAQSNVAIATGAPAGFWVLDLDGPEAVAWLAAKEAEHGPLPVTPTSLTARGEHRCFAWCPKSSSEPIIRNRSGLDGAPVDVRGQDGYILAPPSVHPGDPKKGVAPGHVYRWADGRSPEDLPFAVAPDWLILLVKPAPPAPVKPMTPRAPAAGRASRFGEIILDRVCAAIASARVGTRDTVLFRESVGIGALVAGGEIEDAYGRAALENAGRVHVPDAMTEAQLIRQVDRAMAWGAQYPRKADPSRRTGGAQERRADMPVRDHHAAQRALDAAAYWAEATSADNGVVRRWMRGLALDPDGVPGALGRMRFHPEAPDRDGELKPMLLAPMTVDGGGPIEVLALFDLTQSETRVSGFMGQALHGRALALTALDGPGPIVVGLDFADAWVVASSMARSGPVRAVACLNLTAFSGGVMMDRFGRVDPVSPRSDPERAPWRIPPAFLGQGVTEVGFAVRRDLITAPLRFRGVVGGTAETRLRGDEAGAYFTSLTVQAWERLALPEGAALRLRPLTATTGVSFHDQQQRAAAGVSGAADNGVRQ